MHNIHTLVTTLGPIPQPPSHSVAPDGMPLVLLPSSGILLLLLLAALFGLTTIKSYKFARFRDGSMREIGVSFIVVIVGATVLFATLPLVPTTLLILLVAFFIISISFAIVGSIFGTNSQQ